MHSYTEVNYTFDMDKVKQDYQQYQGAGREAKKWLFAIGTLGLGGLYLWATTVVVKEGQIGLRCTNRGEMVLLPPGRHSNFPWESYPVAPQSLSDNNIDLGPYKILRVETGNVAKILHNGVLEIFQAGRYLLNTATHEFKHCIEVKQETKIIEPVKVATSDSVGLTIDADVVYQITDPDKAVRNCGDINGRIVDTAKRSIAQVVCAHALSDFAPMMATMGRMGTDVPVEATQAREHQGILHIIEELKHKISEQLEVLGVNILNIGITSWRVTDPELAKALASGAVDRSMAISHLNSATQEAQTKLIAAEADRQATVLRAKGEAEGIEIVGAAVAGVAERIKDNPAAQQIYALKQYCNMVKDAKDPHLFFSQQPNFQPPVVATLPLSASAGTL